MNRILPERACSDSFEKKLRGWRASRNSSVMNGLRSLKVNRHLGALLSSTIVCSFAVRQSARLPRLSLTGAGPARQPSHAQNNAPLGLGQVRRRMRLHYRKRMMQWQTRINPGFLPPTSRDPPPFLPLTTCRTESEHPPGCLLLLAAFSSNGPRSVFSK